MSPFNVQLALGNVIVAIFATFTTYASSSHLSGQTTNTLAGIETNRTCESFLTVRKCDSCLTVACATDFVLALAAQSKYAMIRKITPAKHPNSEPWNHMVYETL